MQLTTQIVSLVLPLILVGLVIPAGIALYRVQSLALPISTVTASATVILPVFTGVVLRGARSLTRISYGGPGEAKVKHSWTAMMLIMLLVIYETVIATLALTHMTPPSALACHLERQWSWLFSNKNAEVIRRIQDRHQCCGLNSAQDRAWPFPDRRHTAAACQEAFGRERSCFGGWRQDEQVTAGLMLFVAVVAFLIQLLMLVTSQSHIPFDWFTRRTSHFSSNRGIAGGNDQRRIGEAYHDDPLVEATATDSQPQGEGDNQGARTGSAVQPSTLHRGENEWRDA